ncbi:Asp23/Gls24 family envelope stress response protein [Lachnospiraceae bacterium JLR.KK008]
MGKDTERNTYALQRGGSIGEVQIADDVVAMIAGFAALEVDGVASMAGNVTEELLSKVGVKGMNKGARVEVTEQTVSVDMAVNLKYGYNIPVVSEKIQEKVKSAIETMTGLSVDDVNIRIVGVVMNG